MTLDIHTNTYTTTSHTGNSSADAVRLGKERTSKTKTSIEHAKNKVSSNTCVRPSDAKDAAASVHMHTRGDDDEDNTREVDGGFLFGGGFTFGGGDGDNDDAGVAVDHPKAVQASGVGAREVWRLAEKLSLYDAEPLPNADDRESSGQNHTDIDYEHTDTADGIEALMKHIVDNKNKENEECVDDNTVDRESDDTACSPNDRDTPEKTFSDPRAAKRAARKAAKKAAKAKKRAKREGRIDDIGKKPCDLCARSVDLLIRCQIDEKLRWHMVCGKCWQKVSGGVVDGSRDHPHYRYGGLWKNRSNV